MYSEGKLFKDKRIAEIDIHLKYRWYKAIKEYNIVKNRLVFSTPMINKIYHQKLFNCIMYDTLL